jgi:hypothetical protein
LTAAFIAPTFVQAFEKAMIVQPDKKQSHEKRKKNLSVKL